MLYHSNFSFLSGLTSWDMRGDIKNIYPELSLYGSKNEFARTVTVFFTIPHVCTMGGGPLSNTEQMVLVFSNFETYFFTPGVLKTHLQCLPYAGF